MKRRILSMLCVLALMLGMITVPAFAADTAGNLQDKVNDYTAGVITLSEDAENLTVEANTYIDLNGHTIAGVTVADGATLYVSDSQTDDYTVADGICGAVTGISGDVRAAEGYLTVTEEDAVSFHRVDLAIKSMSLRPGNAGVYYTSSFAADETVAAKVESYGVALSVAAEPTAENLETLCGYSVLYDFGAGAVNGTLLTGIMDEANTAETNAANAAMPVYGRAYIKTAEGYTFGAVVVRDLQEQVEAIDAIFADLTETQKSGILAMYATYKAAMADWNIPSIRGEQLGDTVITVPVQSENGVVTEEITVESNGMSITIPFGALVEAAELTLSVTKKAQSDSGIEASEDQTLMPFDVHVEGISPENTVPLTVALGKVMPENLNMGNYSIYHVEADGTKEMELVANEDAFTAHNQFKYTLDGEVIIHVATFSEMTLTANLDNAWAGGVAESFAGGTGTAEDPYLIRNADQLAYLNVLISAGNEDYNTKSYKLLADINFAGEEETTAENIWYPIGYWKQETDADGVNYFTYGGAFSGVFDGNGNTISNIYQNTWIMKGSYSGHYWDDAMGIFGYVYGGTVKNLTVEKFSSDGEFTPTGCVAAYAAGSDTANAVFENIALVDCNPRVYNTGNGGIVGIGGSSSDQDTYDEETGTCTGYALEFNNITIDNSNVISALWGSWDVACGGLVGMFRGPGHAFMTDCHVAAQMDVYNDVCGNYQYYWYRYSGMLIGTNKNMTTDEAGYTVPETAKFHAKDCTVHFGEWNNYYYCELVANSLASYTHDHQFSRLTQISALSDIYDETTQAWTATGNYLLIDGETKTCYHIRKAEDGTLYQHNHTDAGYEDTIDEDGDGKVDLKEDKQIVYLPFNQLFTGYGWGVKHVPIYDDGRVNPFEGVTILDREIADSVVKFDSLLPTTLAQDKENLVVAENTVLSIGKMFSVNSERAALVNANNIQVFVSPADENSTVEAVTYTSTGDDWATGTLQFKGRGKATITITDYYFCEPTVITVTVGSVNDAAKAMVLTGNAAISAVCPACAFEGNVDAIATWNALATKAYTLKGTSTTETVHDHRYLVKGEEYSNEVHYMVSQTTNKYLVAMCLHLNNGTITSTVRALTVDGGNATMNVMGDGTVIGGGMDPASLANTVPSRGTVDSTGTLNMYGGTYKCTRTTQPVLSLRGLSNSNTNMYEGVTIDRSETKGLSIFVFEDNDFNMYGGTVIGGDSTDLTFKNSKNSTCTIYGGNIWIRSTTSSSTVYTATVNVYGGTITGGSDTVGGNVYITGYDTKPEANLNIYGGSITEGNVYFTGKNASVMVSGAAKVDEIKLGSGKLIDVGELTGDASVTINAAVDVTVSNPITATNGSSYGKYFHASADGLDVTVVDGVLKVVDEVCPHCDSAYQEIEWIELVNANGQQEMSGEKHYRLAESLTSGTNTLITKKSTEHDVVLDLNGKNITSTALRAVLVYGSGNFTLFDSVGTGTLSTTSKTEALGGAVFYVTDTVTANIYGGKFEAGADTRGNGSCIGVYSSGATLNIYSAQVVGNANEQAGNRVGGAIYTKGTLHIYDIDLDVNINLQSATVNGIYADAGSVLTIEGGTYDVEGAGEDVRLVAGKGSIRLYGGEINGKVKPLTASALIVGYDVVIDEVEFDSGFYTKLQSLNGASIGVTAVDGVPFTPAISAPNSYLDDFYPKNPDQYLAIQTADDGTRKLIISNVEPCACCVAVNPVLTDLTELTKENVASMMLLGGHYRLMNDVHLTAEIVDLSQIALKKNMMLDLNGHKLTSDGRCFYVSSGGRLTIRDNGEKVNGEYTGALIANYNSGGGPIYVDTNSCVDMYGGNLSNAGTPYIGGTVYVRSAIFNLYDGVVHGCDMTRGDNDGTTIPKGGAIYITNASGKAGGTVNIYGGTIKGGYAAGVGDCIYANGGYLNVYGGTIAIDETASATNAIYAHNATVLIDGGTVVGQIKTTKSNKVTISGAPNIDNLDLTNSVTVKIGALSEGASITVKATDGVFTNVLDAETAQSYIESQYIKLHESIADKVLGVDETGAIAVVDAPVVEEPETGDETTEPTEPEA